MTSSISIHATWQRRGKLITLAIILSLFSATAYASSVVFDATGTFDNGNTLSGTLTIDTITGNPVSADLMVSGHSAAYTTLQFQGTWPQTSPFMTELSFGNGEATDNYLTFLFEPVSLVGYTGGPLCGTNPAVCQDSTLIYRSSLATFSGGSVFNFSDLVSGSLTSASAPEPGGAALLSVGIASLAGIARRRWLR